MFYATITIYRKADKKPLCWFVKQTNGLTVSYGNWEDIHFVVTEKEIQYLALMEPVTIQIDPDQSDKQFLADAHLFGYAVDHGTNEVTIKFHIQSVTIAIKKQNDPIAAYDRAMKIIKQ